MTITRQDALDQFTIHEPLPQRKSIVHHLSSSESGPSGSKPQPDESEKQPADAEATFLEAWYKMIIQDLEGEAKGKGLDTFPRQGDNPEDVNNKEERKPSEVEEQKMHEEEEPFQKAIRQAMEKLQDSDDTLKVRMPCFSIIIDKKAETIIFLNTLGGLKGWARWLRKSTIVSGRLETRRGRC